MAAREVVVVDSIRTGLAKAHRGSFNLTRSDDMLAHCIDALLERNPNVSPDEVEDVVVGAANHTGEQDGNLARLAVVLSRLPISTAGMTINRFCSSGLQSIAIASNQIASGQTDIANGRRRRVDLDERAPGGRRSTRRATSACSKKSPTSIMAMGDTAEVVATSLPRSRARCRTNTHCKSQAALCGGANGGRLDCRGNRARWTATMHEGRQGRRARRASEDVDRRSRRVQPADNDPPRALRVCKPAFAEDGSVTAGNASQLSDGASMTLLMSADRAAQLGIEPMGIFRGLTVAGCEPDEMGIGPVFSVPRLLDNSGLSMKDIDLWELNEAFASQCVYCRDRLAIDNEIYNVNGGSISIGHPFGMTGSRCTGTVLRELERRNKRYGVVTMCIGGGQGAAGLFERA